MPSASAYVAGTLRTHSTHTHTEHTGAHGPRLSQARAKQVRVCVRVCDEIRGTESAAHPLRGFRDQVEHVEGAGGRDGGGGEGVDVHQPHVLRRGVCARVHARQETSGRKEERPDAVVPRALLRQLRQHAFWCRSSMANRDAGRPPLSTAAATSLAAWPFRKSGNSLRVVSQSACVVCYVSAPCASCSACQHSHTHGWNAARVRHAGSSAAPQRSTPRRTARPAAGRHSGACTAGPGWRRCARGGRR
jgi:hypothetical protein